MNAKLIFMHKKTVESGYIVQKHSHRCHELVFYGSACQGKTVIDDEEYDFQPGDIAINRSGSLHSEKYFSSGKIEWIGFECDNFNLNNKIYHNLWDVKLILNIISKEMINQPYKHEEFISHKLCELLLCIERTQFTNVCDNKNLIFSKNYIEENYTQNININNLAKSSGYSPAHFRHLFQKNYGASPQDYLIDVRCQKAIELLKYTKLTCAEIASQCGFYDSSQLSRMLKNKYSTTPLAIRQKATF